MMAPPNLPIASGRGLGSNPAGPSAANRIDNNIRLICPDCKDPNPDIIEDFSQGDLICGRCGIVLGDRIIDTRSEWRTFSNEGGEQDPSRVGGPSNPLLDGSQLDTIISKNDKGTGLGRELSKWQNKTALTAQERQLLEAFKDIAIMSEKISLPQTIQDRAKQIYKKAEQTKSLRNGRTNEAMIAAAIYIACRQEFVPRTFKEICSVTRVPKKEIGRLYKLMVKDLDSQMSTISTEDFMSRFCSNLDLPMEIQKPAIYLTKKANELGCVAGKSPISVAAAGIYLISQLSKTKRSQKDIAQVAGVSEVTIRNSYKDLYLNRHKLVPPDFKIMGSIDDLPPA